MTSTRTEPKKSKTVEFIQELPFIREHLQKNYQAKAIWKSLHSDHKVTMTYQMFTLLMRRYLPEATLKGNAFRVSTPEPEEALSKSNKAQDISPDLPPAIYQETLNESPAQTPAKKRGGFVVDPNRPKRAPVEMPKPWTWNPIPLTDEEIRTGIITSR